MEDYKEEDLVSLKQILIPRNGYIKPRKEITSTQISISSSGVLENLMPEFITIDAIVDGKMVIQEYKALRD